MGPNRRFSHIGKSEANKRSRRAMGRVARWAGKAQAQIVWARETLTRIGRLNVMHDYSRRLLRRIEQ